MEKLMTRVLRLLPIVLLLAVGAAPHTPRTVAFLPVSELGYRLVPDEPEACYRYSRPDPCETTPHSRGPQAPSSGVRPGY